MKSGLVAVVACTVFIALSHVDAQSPHNPFAFNFTPQGTTHDGTTWENMSGTWLQQVPDSVCLGRFQVFATDHNGEVHIWDLSLASHRQVGSPKLLPITIVSEVGTKKSDKWSLRLAKITSNVPGIDGEVVALQMRGKEGVTIDWGYSPGGDPSGWLCMNGAT